jgi:hypothetical protein
MGFGNFRRRKLMEMKRVSELFEQNPDKEEIQIGGVCHDCKETVTVTVRKIAEGYMIFGGAVYEPEKGSGNYYLKCDDCYDKDPVLRNYQECEVYSRVVGYLRPVSQWNDGKQAEFSMRKTFYTAAWE